MEFRLWHPYALAQGFIQPGPEHCRGWCHGLTWQSAIKHQTAAHSPFPLPLVGWGGEWAKGKTHGLK